MRLLSVLCAITVLGLLSPLAAQQIDVQRPAGTSLANGATDQLGKKTGKGTFALTYTIENVDATTLDLTGTFPVTVSGAANVNYQLVQPGAASLDQNQTTTFEISVSPLDDGAYRLNLSIASNDPDDPAFLIRVRGDTGTKKEEDDCSTREGSTPGALMMLGALSALVLGVRRLRSSRQPQ